MSDTGNGERPKTIDHDGTTQKMPGKLQRHSLHGLREGYGDIFDGLMANEISPKTGQEANRALAGSLNTFRVELEAMQKANLGEKMIRRFTTKLLGMIEDEPKKLEESPK